MSSDQSLNTESKSTGIELQAEIDLLRATEGARLRSLVQADMETANKLHADDFQLISPAGASFSKVQYLDGVASGILNYVVWEPEAIEVRFHGHMAILRYQAQLEIIVGGEAVPLRRYWHTDSCEKRNGTWQAVWSHATEIK